MPTYEATYTFDGHSAHDQAAAIDRHLSALDEFREAGVDLDHLGTTVTLDAAGGVEQVVSQYRAASEGAVGWHGWLAQLPVSGIRRLDSPARVELPA